jgi:RNA polymerase sigma-70 factor (ECF subfamily)
VLDRAEVGRIFRQESGRSVATLIGAFGDIDLAEDAVQEAFAIALHKWPRDGVPPNPGGWITTTARNHVLDRLRRESRGRQLLNEVAMRPSGEDDHGMSQQVGSVRDDRLRLIFTCCHPALSTEAQVALTLRLLGGLSTRQVAGSFLVSEATMAARLVRAKRKIKAARIPTACHRPTSCPTASARYWPSFTSSTTPGRPAWPNRICALRRFGWRGSWRRSCPTSQRRPACWRCCC